MNEWACVAIEVDPLLRIKQHVLACIHFQDEIFQGSETNDACNALLFVLAHVVEFAQLVAHLACIADHGRNEFVGINHRSFAAFHLSVGQFHHAIGEMHQLFAPFEAQSVEQNRQHLEVIVLLIAHHINHFVDGIVLKAHLGRADILRHIDRSAVAAQQQFLV